MTKKVIIGFGIICLLILLSLGALYLFGKDLAGGGGIDQTVPDTIQAGEPAIIKLEPSVWGGGGPIKGRYTEVSLHYQLVGENNYKTLQPKLISQEEKRGIYEFTIPPYPIGTTGEITFYFDFKFDGNVNRVDGMKKIKLVDQTTPTTLQIQECGAKDITATAGYEGATGSMAGWVRYSNHTSATCVLGGYPKIKLQDRNGNLLVVKDAGMFSKEYESPKKLEIKPQQEVLSEFSWQNWCLPKPNGPISLVVTLPDESELAVSTDSDKTPRCDIPNKTSTLSVGPFINP